MAYDSEKDLLIEKIGTYTGEKYQLEIDAAREKEEQK